MTTSRRDLLKTAAAGALGFGLAPRAFAQGAPQNTPQRPPRQAGPLPDGIERAATPLRILILGGTGFTGPHQVRYALARGHKLTLFNRGRNPYMWPGEVEELTGDRNTGDLKSLEGREWDVCVDNPTTLPFWVRDAGQVLKGKVGQYIFISTLSVHATESVVGADETAPVLEYKGADPMKETQDTLRANIGGLYGPLKARSEEKPRRGSRASRPSSGPRSSSDPVTNPIVSPTGRSASTGAVTCWRLATAPITSSSSTPATWPSGRSAWPRHAPSASSPPPAPGSR